MFFAEKASDRTPIDYAVAVNGGLRLVPGGDGLKALEEDYARMVDDGLPPITYRSGGLESAEIRKAVCDILEGGEGAFQERARRLRVRLDR